MNTTPQPGETIRIPNATVGDFDPPQTLVVRVISYNADTHEVEGELIATADHEPYEVDGVTYRPGPAPEIGLVVTVEVDR